MTWLLKQPKPSIYKIVKNLLKGVADHSGLNANSDINKEKKSTNLNKLFIVHQRDRKHSLPGPSKITNLVKP